MKKTNFVLCMLLSVMAMLTSCLSNSESEVTLYDDAAITSFTLGTLTQYEPGTDKAVATLTGSNYPMTIDHLNNKIYNSALLPVGTAVNNVVCTVTTMNNGVIQLKDSVNDTFEWFDANYGVDLSREAPRIFRVWASDASFYRDYAVKVNVANSSGDNFTWGAAVADTVLLKGFTDMRLVTLKNKRIVALCGDGAYTYVRFSDDFGTTWDQPQTQEVLADSAWASAVVKDSTLFLLSYGRLSSSADGERWDSSTDADELKQLVATSHGELFALAKDSTMKASADNGISWYDQLADEGLSTDSLKQLLALNDIASTSFDYEFSYHADYVLMAGNNGSAENQSLRPPPDCRPVVEHPRREHQQLPAAAAGTLVAGLLQRCPAGLRQRH